MDTALLDVVVHSVTAEAEGVLSFELRPADGGELPAFGAGAHIDLHLPNGLVRSYSLVNPQNERNRYVIAVSLDRNSTGGSRWMFDNELAGKNLQISPPINNFPLAEDATQAVLIAGGIGITPLYAMIRRMEETGQSWELHYGARDRASTAFRESLEALEAAGPGRVHFNFDAEEGRMLDVAAIVANAPADAHLYCCGPLPMLEIFNDAVAGRDPETVHIEYFTAPDAQAASEDAVDSFIVELARSGGSYEIPKGETILGVLLDNGVNAASYCQEGMCGTCLVEVLEGEPDHRDFILSDRERESNRLMLICVSGSKSKKLVIDL